MEWWVNELKGTHGWINNNKGPNLCLNSTMLIVMFWTVGGHVPSATKLVSCIRSFGNDGNEKSGSCNVSTSKSVHEKNE